MEPGDLQEAGEGINSTKEFKTCSDWWRVDCERGIHYARVLVAGEPFLFARAGANVQLWRAKIRGPSSVVGKSNPVGN